MVRAIVLLAHLMEGWVQQVSKVEEKRLLVVAAHPDGEVLGRGATVRSKVNQGWRARLVIMTSGITGG